MLKLSDIKLYNMDLPEGILCLASSWQQGEILQIHSKEWKLQLPSRVYHFKLYDEETMKTKT